MKRCAGIVLAVVMIACVWCGVTVAVPPPPLGQTGHTLEFVNEWYHYTRIEENESRCYMKWDSDLTWDCPNSHYGSLCCALGFSLHYNGNPLSPAKQWTNNAWTTEGAWVNVVTQPSTYVLKSVTHDAFGDYHSADDGDYHAEEIIYENCHRPVMIPAITLVHAEDNTPSYSLTASVESKPGQTYREVARVKYNWDQALTTNYPFVIKFLLWDGSAWVTNNATWLSWDSTKNAQGEKVCNPSSQFGTDTCNTCPGGRCLRVRFQLVQDPGGANEQLRGDVEAHLRPL